MANKIVEGKARKCKYCRKGMRFIENDIVHICCLARSRGGVCGYVRKEK